MAVKSRKKNKRPRKSEDIIGVRDLADAMSRRSGIPIRETRRIMGALSVEVATAIAAGKRVYFPNLGCFYTRTRRAHKFKAPHLWKGGRHEVNVKETIQVIFKASSWLKAANWYRLHGELPKWWLDKKAWLNTEEAKEKLRELSDRKRRPPRDFNFCYEKLAEADLIDRLLLDPILVSYAGVLPADTDTAASDSSPSKQASSGQETERSSRTPTQRQSTDDSDASIDRKSDSDDTLEVETSTSDD